MARVKVNANLTHFLDKPTKVTFRYRLKEAILVCFGEMSEFFSDFGMTASAVYSRMSDPDKFTVGELRQLRHTINMNKADFIELLRPLL